METAFIILITLGAIYYFYRQTFVNKGCNCGTKGHCKDKRRN